LVVDGIKYYGSLVVDGIKHYGRLVVDGIKHYGSLVVDGIKNGRSLVVDGIKNGRSLVVFSFSFLFVCLFVFCFLLFLCGENVNFMGKSMKMGKIHLMNVGKSSCYNKIFHWQPFPIPSTTKLQPFLIIKHYGSLVVDGMKHYGSLVVDGIKHYGSLVVDGNHHCYYNPSHDECSIYL
jgi:hypothetical protein